MLSPLESYKAWLVWAHDPCQEGGWHISSQHDTKDEALAAAKALDERQEKQFRDMVELSKTNRKRDEWLRSYECYDGCMVTSGPVSMIRVDNGVESRSDA